ncbi:MAG TPA: HlyD family efflux transporter periplasmic adaptor subunit [Balneolaceae bacterium]
MKTGKSDKHISGGGMDKKIKKKTWTAKRIFILAGGIAITVLFIYAFAFMDSRSTLNVEKEKLTISTAREGSFQEFIQITGTVQPIQTIYLDAIEGGVVQDIYKESGIMVEKGDTILTLANSGLRLQVMQQTSNIYDQINNIRTSRLNYEQNNLRLRDQLAHARSQMEIYESQYQRQQSLFEKDLISEQEFIQTRENYQYQKTRFELTLESYRQDSLQMINQMAQLDRSEERMWQSLEAVQNILDNLIVRAPISGQLSTIELNPGQSISPGERIGQVDILDNYKIRVAIDEYYLARITTGLRGSFGYDGRSHNLVITKIYPVINNGQFQVDMEFVKEAPDGLRRGQTLRIRLELGESTNALLLARGGFYQSTGGNWVFKVSKDGSQAFKQPIHIGRQNPEYFEVLSGLEPGDKVITSGYDTFGENEVLVLE